VSLNSNLKTIAYIIKHPFNKDQKIKALWNYLRWQIGTRLVSAPVIMPWVDKTVLVASKGETGVTQNIYCGLHEFSEMGFVLHFLRKEDQFIDVGANSGVYSILAAGCCGARGIAVEPVPSTFRRLTQQIGVNQLDHLVQARNIGVADKNGSLYFTTDSDTTNRIVDKEWNGPKDLLPVTTIDLLAGERPPALMKIDVEGNDHAVLLGAGNTLASDILKAVIIEISPPSVFILSRCGFIPCGYDPFQRRLTKLEWAKISGCPNVIAVRDFEAVQARLRSAPVRSFHGKRF
jgi:FkbM family methyltransferase